MRGVVATYWPERTEKITGVAEEQLVRAARLLGAAKRPMVLTARGSEQQAQGVTNTLAFINLALALGKRGQPFTGFGTITGQGNGQGGREHGQKADQLPGYRRIDDPAARAHMASVWGIHASDIPGPGRSAYELLDSMGQEGGVRALILIGSNPVVSAPRAVHVEQRFRALDLLVVADFFLSETAALADVVLPSAQWAEEEGTMTNLEGRVILRRRAMETPAGVREDIDILHALAERLGWGPQFAFASSRDVFDELRRATAGGVRRLLRDHVREDRRERRRLLALPVARSSGHAAHLRRTFRDAERPARASIPCDTSRRPRSRTPSIRSISRRAACSRSTSRARRRGAFRRSRRCRPSRWPRSIRWPRSAPA